MSARTIDFRWAPQDSQFLICLADDPYKALVWEDGSLCYGFDPKLEQGRLTMFDPRQPACWSQAQQNRGFRFRWRPRALHHDQLLSQRQDYGSPQAAIVTTCQMFRYTQLEWTIFAWRGGDMRADIILWRLQAQADAHPAPSRVVLDILGQQQGEGMPQVIAAQPEQMGALAPGDSWQGAFYIAYSGDVAKVASLAHAQEALAWAHDYWANLKPFAHALDIPDAQIMQMLAACGRNILQAREYRDGLLTFQVGPTHYRGQWIADGYFILECAQIMGRQRDCLPGILGILRHVRADGAITIMPHHEKETGIAIASLLRQCELLGDDLRIRELWPTILRAFRFIRFQRQKAYALGQDYPAWGLFPPTFGDGGVYGPEPEYTTPLWMLAGLKKAWQTAQRLGLPGEQTIRREYESLRKFLLRAIRRDLRAGPEGIPYFPISMRPQPNGYTPYTGTWALAQAIAPGEVFLPDDPLVQNFLRGLDSIDNTEGIPENTGWLNQDALWGYASMFYAQVWLYALRADKAVDYLYAFINHASPGRCWREEQALQGRLSGAIWGDMPHNWGSAECIRLVRNLLSLERLEQLELLAGLPSQWLPQEGQRLYVELTPTRWGPITLQLTNRGGHFAFLLQTFFWRAPQNIWLHWQGRRTGLALDAQGQWNGDLAPLTVQKNAEST